MIALDVVLIVLTITCIVYCMVLNKRIFQIQKYRTEMLKLFKEFDKSIDKAQQVLKKTEDLVSEAEERVELATENSKRYHKELVIASENADKLAEELETIIISGNKLFSKLSEVILDGCETVEKRTNQSGIMEEIDEFQDKIRLSQIDYYEILQGKKSAAE